MSQLFSSQISLKFDEMRRAEKNGWKGKTDAEKQEKYVEATAVTMEPGKSSVTFYLLVIVMMLATRFRELIDTVFGIHTTSE